MRLIPDVIPSGAALLMGKYIQVDGHSTQITYVPAIKDVKWEKCFHSESAEHPHRAKKIEITSESTPEVSHCRSV